MGGDSKQIEEHRLEVARAKRRLRSAAGGGVPTLEARPVVHDRAGVGQRLLTAAAANPGAAASIGVAVLCLLGVGGTVALAGRAVRLAAFAAAVTRVLRSSRP